MSNYFEMRFLQVNSWEEMFKTCTKFANALASRNISRKYLQTILSHMEQVPNDPRDREHLIQAYFQVRFVYWPQLNLLGLPTKEWPEELFGDFAFTAPIQFQDNTDQDYPEKTWKGILAFEALQDTVWSLPDNTIMKQFDWDGPYGLEDLAYVRRSLVYKTIFGVLQLNDWLEGNSGQFDRFVFSGITTTEQLHRLATIFRVMAMDREKTSPHIRRTIWESTYSEALNLREDSLKFLLSEVEEARKTSSIRPGSYLSDLVVNYKADHQCLSTDLALKEVEAGIKTVLAERCLEAYDTDEDAIKNGWLYLCKDKKDVKIIRGLRQEGDAWEFAVIVADWGDPLILGTFADADSARAFIKDNGYNCVADESLEALDD